MSAITVKVNPGKVLKSIDQFGKGFQINLLALVRKHLEQGVAKLKQEHFKRSSDSSVGYKTGKLYRTVKLVPPVIVGEKITGGIRIGDETTPYTKIHVGAPRGAERTIKIKSKQALTIPTKWAKTAAGIPRGPAFVGGKPNPIWGITFIRKGIIFGYLRGTSRKYAKPVPLFVLKEEITFKTKVDPVADVQRIVLPALKQDLKILVKLATAFK